MEVDGMALSEDHVPLQTKWFSMVFHFRVMCSSECTGDLHSP